MKTKWTAFLICCMLAFTVFGAAAAAQEDGAERWEVSVGKETDDGVSIDAMFPSVIYIHVGDTVNFTNGAKFTPHTVTFLAGAAPLTSEDPTALIPAQERSVEWDGQSLLNSGVMQPGQNYEITFTSVGAFSYYCILHPMMRGTVVVLPDGAPIPSKEEQAIAAQMLLADLTAQAETVKLAHRDVHVSPNADGSATHSIALGGGHHGFSVNKMMPETVYISAGDTMEWVNLSPYEPHWVTFNKPDDLDFFTPFGEINPAFIPPAGGPEFDGTGFVNSGIVPGGAKYRLTFTRPGVYRYECYLHSGSLMTGTVVVAPKGAVKVTVNGEPLVLDYDAYDAAYTHNRQAYAPAVPFFQALGAEVSWNAELGAVVVHFGGEHALPARPAAGGGTPIIVDGEQVLFSEGHGVQIIHGRAYVPLQEIVGFLHGSYSWDEITMSLDARVNFENHENMTHHAH